METIYLAITSKTELNCMQRAIEMQFDLENDVVLDETVVMVKQVRDLANLSDDEIRDRLVAIRKETESNIDRLLITGEMRARLDELAKL